MIIKGGFVYNLFPAIFVKLIMTRIGLLKEGKIPPDNRVALTPAQCKWLQKTYPDLKIFVQSSNHRCFYDKEYQRVGIEVVDNLEDCDILFGIKEVPVPDLVENKTYLFFSHTRKKQAHNQKLLQTIIDKKITLIDYECMEHEDGQRIIGFGFFCRHSRCAQRDDGLWQTNRFISSGTSV